ncbi:putative peptidoglycan glycosyltransferase FtsW [Caldilinea sp.]|jgi:cell division protein FtsW|nr:putative peptidoglycan glycosyltransferase FtsW [Caldilinea sp.]MBO9391810.1 cell division protein FtsW [Caldilinea sp.]GIV73187.1 MAG: stage V sporulation protein E [Caldilinea sp.]
MQAKTSDRAGAKSRDKGRYDWGLLSVVTILLMLGLVMVFSASYVRGIEGFNNPYYFIGRQLMWLALGVVGLVVAARVPYTVWERWSIPIMGATLLALLVLIPLGAERFGARRTFFEGSVQPSEAAKIAIIIYVSAWLASKGRRIRDVRAGLLPFGVLMGIVTVLIVLQPEISTAVLIVATSAVMLFVAGAAVKQLVVIGIVTAGTFLAVIYYSSYAADRVARYLDSIGNPVASDEWQVRQGVEALMRGGLFGRGLGNGLAQQTGYLPLTWSDNIFGVIGEEMGLLGALFVIALFALLAYRGLRIALRAPDAFGMLLATGVTTSLILQALLNMAVIAAISPPTGVTLPFVSYGGSSLVASLVGIGLLLSISRYSVDTASRTQPTGRYAYERVDLGRGDGRSRLSGAGGRGAARAGGYHAETPRGAFVGDGRVRRGGKPEKRQP